MDELTDLLERRAVFLFVVTLLIVGAYQKVDRSSVDGFTS